MSTIAIHVYTIDGFCLRLDIVYFINGLFDTTFYFKTDILLVRF